MDPLPALLLLICVAWITWRAPALCGQYGDRVPPRGVLLGGAMILGGLSLLIHPLATPVASVGWVSAAIDWRVRRLPMEVTAVLAVQVLVLLAFRSSSWSHSAISAGLWLLPVLVGYLLRQVGFGDVLFAPVLGLSSGGAGIILSALGLAVAFVAAGFVAAIRIMASENPKGSGLGRIPLGPFLWAGSLAGLFSQGMIHA